MNNSNPLQLAFPYAEVDETYFTKVYRLTGRRYCKDLDGIECHDMRFSNAHETLITRVYKGDFISDQEPDLALLKVSGVCVRNLFGEHMEISSIRKLTQSEYSELPPLFTLPEVRSSKSGVLRRLQNLISREISNPSLRQFIKTVLEGSDVMRLTQFMECPASISFHHSYKGGLFEHSAEVVFKMIEEMDGWRGVLTEDERQVGIVAALFHDIGKVEQYGLDGKPLESIAYLKHDDLNTEVCGVALKELKKSEPEMANLLRFLLSPRSDVSHPLSICLQSADRFSEAHDDYTKLSRSNSRRTVRSLGRKRYLFSNRLHS